MTDHSKPVSDNLRSGARTLSRAKTKVMRDIGGALERYLAPSSPGRFIDARQYLRGVARDGTAKKMIEELLTGDPVETELIDALSEIVNVFA